MLDIFNINDGSTNKRVFYPTGVNSFQTWQKPHNAKFVHFFVMGSGGGGGGGQAAGTGTARRGGGSGGSAAHVTALFTAIQIPDTLFINVGTGGQGGVGLSASTAGASGALSYVMIHSDTGFTATNVLLQNGAAAPTGGGNGSGTGSAGVAGTVWVGTGSLLYDMGLINSYAGSNGVLGQTTPIPDNTLVSGMTTGGGVGAGMNGATPQNGGSIIGFGSVVPTISGGTSASTLTIHGSGGYMSSVPNTIGMTYQQMYFTGGAGGASSNAASGGDGGNAAFGCGGGGGGAGFTNLAGNGGRGGDGLVIITTW